MTFRTYFRFETLVLFSLLFTVACQPKEESVEKTYNRTELLEDLHAQWQEDTENVLENVNYFLELLEADGFQQFQFDSASVAFEQAYSAWSKFQVWRYPVVAETGLMAMANSFPTDTVRLMEKVTQQDYQFFGANDLGATGFPAMDYLLVQLRDNPDTLAFEYIRKTCEELTSKLNLISSSLSTEHKASFVANNGIAIGSSIGDFVNYFNQEFEFSKNFRVAIPSGIRTAGIPLPEKAEYRFIGNGKSTLKAATQHLAGLFQGTQNRIGLKHYLDFLEVSSQGMLLSDRIVDNFNVILSFIDTLPEDIEEANSEDLTTLFQQMQSLVVLIKSDMPSALGIQINYVDNDGD